MKPFVMDCDIACFRALGVKIDKIGSCFVSNTGASNPILNCVYSFDGNDVGIEPNAKQILGTFKARGLPHCWWTETTSEPPQLKETLREHGKKLLGEFLGMALNLSEIESESVAHDLAISRISTNDEFSAWGCVIARAFHFIESDAELYTSLFVKAGSKGPFFHLTGQKNGRVVSVGTILCTEEGAYIYNVATAKNERGKGYGSSITQALIEIARENGQTRVALVSSQEAASIYRKLGFQEVCRFNIYA